MRKLLLLVVLAACGSDPTATTDAGVSDPPTKESYYWYCTDGADCGHGPATGEASTRYCTNYGLTAQVDQREACVARHGGHLPYNEDAGIWYSSAADGCKCTVPCRTFGETCAP